MKSVLIVLFLLGTSEFEVFAQGGLDSNRFYDSTGNYLGQSQSSNGTTRYYDDVGNYLGQSVDTSQYGGRPLRRSMPPLPYQLPGLESPVRSR